MIKNNLRKVIFFFPLKIEKMHIKRAKRVSKINENLLNKDYLNKIILTNARYSSYHGAKKGFLGCGMFYYSFVHVLKAKVAVCLGSGGGFVPRLMRLAQRDLGIAHKSRTILIDANLPEANWGSPDYLHENSYQKVLFPNIEIIVKTTKEAFEILKSKNIIIDYLHIDADHSHDGSLSDYEIYRPLMSENFIITLHDTKNRGVARTIKQIRKKKDIEIIDFNYLYAGLAIIKPKLAPDIPVKLRMNKTISVAYEKLMKMSRKMHLM